MEVLFRGPLNGVTEAVKSNYVIYWSGDHGMDLVDKWTTEGKINDGNKEMVKTYWDRFDEYVHPQTNKLITVVELKWLFQGTMSLEDFHTKAMRLVTQVGYEGDAKDQVLRDTIISGITSEKIRAKIVKEGHKVTLNQVMEIARLEVSTQHHLDRMQDTVKVNYVQYGKSTKNKKGKKSAQSGASGGNHRGDRGHGTSSKPSRKARSFHSHKTLATDVAKTDTRKPRTVELWMLCAEVVEKRDTLRKPVSRLNIPHIHSRFHKLPPILQRPVNPSTLMMMDNQYLHIWSVFLMQTNIQSSFP